MTFYTYTRRPEKTAFTSKFYEIIKIKLLRRLEGISASEMRDEVRSTRSFETLWLFNRTECIISYGLSVVKTYAQMKLAPNFLFKASF